MNFRRVLAHRKEGRWRAKNSTDKVEGPHRAGAAPRHAVLRPQMRARGTTWHNDDVPAAPRALPREQTRSGARGQSEFVASHVARRGRRAGRALFLHRELAGPRALTNACAEVTSTQTWVPLRDHGWWRVRARASQPSCREARERARGAGGERKRSGTRGRGPLLIVSRCCQAQGQQTIF